eukprot:5667903-Prymnesium_polylepis.1
MAARNGREHARARGAARQHDGTRQEVAALRLVSSCPHCGTDNITHDGASSVDLRSTDVDSERTLGPHAPRVPGV